MTQIRTLLSGAIELMIDALDQLDGDPDFEHDNDLEDDAREINSAPRAHAKVKPRVLRRRHG